jgi:hypothetical protein
MDIIAVTIYVSLAFAIGGLSGAFIGRIATRWLMKQSTGRKMKLLVLRMLDMALVYIPFALSIVLKDKLGAEQYVVPLIGIVWVSHTWMFISETMAAD